MGIDSFFMPHPRSIPSPLLSVAKLFISSFSSPESESGHALFHREENMRRSTAKMSERQEVEGRNEESIGSFFCFLDEVFFFQRSRFPFSPLYLPARHLRKWSLGDTRGFSVPASTV